MVGASPLRELNDDSDEARGDDDVEEDATGLDQETEGFENA